MKFLVISDIHDNLANLEKCLNWGRQQSIDEAICLGDLANSETLKYLADNLKTIYLVSGNMEIYDAKETQQYANIKYLGRFGQVEIDGQTIGLCHEPWYIKSVLGLKPCRLVFYGHTHKPWIAEQRGITTVNPGTLAGIFTNATFAVWDSQSGEVELKILELL